MENASVKVMGRQGNVVDHKKQDTYAVGSLFAGIGGIDIGFAQAGFHIAWANEIDRHACATYRMNHSNTLVEGDMKEIDPSELDPINILIGGFPCQAFSVAGYQKGFKDERGNVFFDILRFIDILTPQVVFLENVKNLERHDGGRTFKVILDELASRGYSVAHRVMNTCEYSNLPQNRERIYIVAFKNEEHAKLFEFPSKKNHTDTIHCFLEKDVDKSYYYDESRYYPVLKDTMTNRDTMYQWRRVYVRENKSGMCPTLTANMGTGGHNVPLILDKKDIRKLTPRECARFQGFSDDFIFPEGMSKSALYKQIGNSVSVPVITLIAKNIKKAMEAGSKNGS